MYPKAYRDREQSQVPITILLKICPFVKIVASRRPCTFLRFSYSISLSYGRRFDTLDNPNTAVQINTKNTRLFKCKIERTAII